jgi:hypothetical protein
LETFHASSANKIILRLAGHRCKLACTK